MLKIVESEPIQIGDMRIIPRACIAQKFGRFGGLFWARPTDVIIETADSTRVVPIPDPTRTIVLACFGLCAATLFSALIKRALARR